jgi:hypothetical protein
VLINFEQQTWDLYKLKGTLNHAQLLLECHGRAQRGDDDAKRRLRVLHFLHHDRKENDDYCWELPNQPHLPEVDPFPQVQATLGPRLWALLIGNDNYPQSPLRGTVNDSKAWKSYLIDFLGVPESHITHIQDANREAMVTALYDLRDNEDIKRGDHILFAYAGHGSSYEARSHSFEDDISLQAPSIEVLCPVDRGLNRSPPLLPVVRDLDQVPEEKKEGKKGGTPDISDREVLLILVDVHDRTGANITFVLDCCHSGGGIRGLDDGNGGGCDRRYRSLGSVDDEEVVERMFAEADDHPRRNPKTLSVRSPTWASDTANIYRPALFAACHETQLAWEENGHGAFTSAIMDVLRSEKGNGLTCSGLIEAIGPLSGNQTPLFDGEETQLFLQ